MVEKAVLNANGLKQKQQEVIPQIDKLTGVKPKVKGDWIARTREVPPVVKAVQVSRGGEEEVSFVGQIDM